MKKTGIELIAEERQRQIAKEGYTDKHDILHSDFELTKLAVAYLTPMDDDTSQYKGGIIDNNNNPFVLGSLKVETTKADWHGAEDYELMRVTYPDPSIRDLVKAGALIAAEIDRLQNQSPCTQ